MNTYRDAYVSALEQALLEGGQLADMEAAVSEYNSFNRAAFDRWLARARLSCLGCGSVMAMGDLSGKDPDAQVICDGCHR